jgi:hypothetical protein
VLGNEFLGNLLSTFVGAFLALALTYLYDRHKARRLEQDERRKVLSTIKHELASNLERIEQFLKDTSAYKGLENDMNKAEIPGAGRFLAIPDVRLERVALDTMLFSGKFFLLDQEILEIVTENYRRSDVVNRSSDDVRAIARGPVDQRHVPIIAALNGIVAGTIGNLRSSLPEAIEKLENRLGS